jgi:hypothetical protein
MLRREVPIFITMGVGIFMVAEFFFPWAENIGTEIQQFAIIMTACAAILGVANVARINLRRVVRKEHDRPYAIVLLVGLAGMMLLGTVFPVVRTLLGVEGEWMIGGFRLSGVTNGTLFDQIYNYLYVPLQATMFSLLAFYIASAAYRAFRIRSMGAGLLAVAAVLVMLGRVPIGEYLWNGLPLISDWVMNVPQLAAKRAILIGAALGAISTGIKVILGIERNYLGSE